MTAPWPVVMICGSWFAESDRVMTGNNRALDFPLEPRRGGKRDHVVGVDALAGGARSLAAEVDNQQRTAGFQRRGDRLQHLGPVLEKAEGIDDRDGVDRSRRQSA